TTMKSMIPTVACVAIAAASVASAQAGGAGGRGGRSGIADSSAPALRRLCATGDSVIVRTNTGDSARVWLRRICPQNLNVRPYRVDSSLSVAVAAANPQLGARKVAFGAAAADDAMSQYFFPPELVMAHQEAIKLSPQARTEIQLAMLQTQTSVLKTNMQM